MEKACPLASFLYLCRTNHPPPVVSNYLSFVSRLLICVQGPYTSPYVLEFEYIILVPFNVLQWMGVSLHVLRNIISTLLIYYALLSPLEVLAMYQLPTIL